MPSLEEQQEVLELSSRPMPIHSSSSHRSSIGSLDDAGSESSVDKKPSSCGSSSSGVSSISSSPTTTNSSSGQAPAPESGDSALGGPPDFHMPYEQIVAQLGILSILDQPDDRKTITTEDEATPTTGAFVPRSYHSDSGASSGCDFSLEGGSSPPVFGHPHQSFLPYGGYGGGGYPGGSGSMGLAEYVDYPGSFDDQMPMRISGVNVTETVPVPSSEHVAEIVGRQGCKIKALRAKTNTYIKTPVRGEEPCFVVTGRKPDVDAAKQEIVNAADHFTQIRASRRHSQGGMPAPGHITAYVRVPYRVVGLVVGPKGATIKRIQQDTHTYIITPSRDREPVFEVTGMPDNVEKARREIEMHIYMRTGNLPITNGYDASHHVAAQQEAQSFHPQDHIIQGSNAPGAPAEAWGSYQQQPTHGIVDFHLNGNDVHYDGDLTQMSSGVISKPQGPGGFGSSPFGAWGQSMQTGSQRSGGVAYPTWSTGGLTSVDRPAAFGFDDKMESLETLMFRGTNDATPTTPMMMSAPPNTPVTPFLAGLRARRGLRK